MARIRSIRPEIWDDEAVAEISREARLLFIGLITQADDDGRLPAQPRWLISKIYPYDELTATELEHWLAELDRAGLILLYAHAGRQYIVLPAWEENQYIDKRYYRESKLPEPPPEPPGSALGAPAGRSAQPDEKAPERSPQDRIGEDRIGEDRTSVAGAPDAAKAPLSHLLADLIAVNDPNGKRPKVTKRWADAERLLIDRDGRTAEQVEAIIRWSQADEFWRANVLSMAKLREKFAQLWQQAQRRNGARSGVSADISRLEEHRRRLAAEEAAA